MKSSENILKKMAKELSVPYSCNLSEKERNVLLLRIAGQMGINDAGMLPYTSALSGNR